MFRIVLGFIMVLHALIHLLGFFKAFQPEVITHITRNISVPAGMLWLLAALLLLFTTVMMGLRIQWWWLPAIVGAVLSQFLVITAWPDAKFGTLANVLILLAALAHVGESGFEKKFTSDVKPVLQRTAALHAPIITEADLSHLPPIVQQYLRYSGAVGKPMVNNMRVVFEGKMRNRKMDWFPFESVQYNSFDEPGRYFFMKGKLFGLLVPGYHRFQQGTATMDIRLFGLYPIVKKSGPRMDQTETVTFFNDMCLMAPATLIDKRISWKEIDSVTAEATFNNNGTKISARLFFDPGGQLVNFESHDRYEINDMKPYPFLTPCRDYRRINGYRIMHEGETVWQYPDTRFAYGTFHLKSIEYNIQAFAK